MTFLKIEYFFSVVLIMLQICAGIVYAFKRDLRMMIYWFAAAVINITVLR